MGGAYNETDFVLRKLGESVLVSCSCTAHVLGRIRPEETGRARPLRASVVGGNNSATIPTRVSSSRPSGRRVQSMVAWEMPSPLLLCGH
eukprot:2169241-Pleurochrysis_carterae.AAC.1